MYKTKFLRKLMKRTLLEYLKNTLVKPQHLLLFRFVFAIVTGIILFFGNYLYSVIFLTTYQFVFLLDYVDGPLARYRKQYSLKWSKFDRIAHYLISILFFLGISVSYFGESSSYLFLSLGLIGSSAIMLTLILELIWLRKFISFKKLRDIHKDKWLFSPIYSFLPIDGPFTLFYFFVLFNVLPFAIIFLSVLYLLILVKKIFILLKWKVRRK